MDLRTYAHTHTHKYIYTHMYIHIYLYTHTVYCDFLREVVIGMREIIGA